MDVIDPRAGEVPTRSRADSMSKIDIEHVEEGFPEKADEQGTRNVDQFGTQLGYPPEERKLVRKLDWHILPILFCMYYMNKTDQNAIANARLNNLEKSLHLKGNQFNICVSVLYAGYTLIQIPSNMLMSTKKVRPSVWMACWMMAWAGVSAATAAVRNYHGLLAVRLLLGFAEAPFYPGAVYLLSLFYTRREIATRISILYSANIFATSFAGLISAATFSALSGKHGLEGWRWLFIILGVVTFVIAIVALWMLPDHPLTTRWLTLEERQLAQDRMNRDTVGLQESKGAIIGFKQALVDKRLWLLVVLQNLHLAACGFNSFFPTVVKTLGFSTTITLVLTCPPYLVSGGFAILLGYLSGRFNERTWHITGGMLVALAGFIIADVTLNTAARYIACFLFATGAYSANSIILGWVSATCGQTPEKKAAALSIVNCISMASFIYTPYLYPATDGPRYRMAMTANACFVTGVIFCTWGLRVWLQAENRRIQRPGAEHKLLYAY
ncbi:MFS transporter [Kwoniella heveanensis BCC8398]|uniref:MFS transporter n=1 Tax=Kwoniella heveanensis BCC8398 TaxID=1296120 RepID=A0A1B9H3Y5_9TREE|nr:MFS transporter [Kwoniella heveanensis BCC8398]